MKIIRLTEIRLSTADVDRLGEEAFSVLATMSYAANEISLMMQLFLSVDPTLPSDDVPRKKARIQHLVITRMMTAKIFEAFEVLEQSRKVLLRGGTISQKEELIRIFDRAAGTKNSKGYRISKEIRDKVTNHYLPSVTKSNLHRLERGLDPTIYLHRRAGDSFYPFAEDFVFGATIAKLAEEHGKTGEEVVEEWMTWCLAASQEFSKALDAISIVLVLERLDKDGWEKTPYVEEELVEDLRQRKLPLFSC